MNGEAQNTLPETGFIRQKQLIPAIIPISRTTLWRMVKEMTFPAPVRISAGAVAWRVEDLRAWLAEHGGALPPQAARAPAHSRPPPALQSARPVRRRRDEKSLLQEAEKWHQASTLRAYVVHISSAIFDRGTPATADESEWLRWAKGVADNMDPTFRRVARPSNQDT